MGSRIRIVLLELRAGEHGRGERQRPSGSAWSGPFVAILVACRADEIKNSVGSFQCFFVVGSVAVCLE